MQHLQTSQYATMHSTSSQLVAAVIETVAIAKKPLQLHLDAHHRFRPYAHSAAESIVAIFLFRINFRTSACLKAYLPVRQQAHS